jgi:hypothetical protein
LALELEELRTADYDLSLTGFDTHEIDALLSIEDDRDADTAPPLPENPVSRTGDLWICGAKNPHRVLCGDSTSPESVARPIPRIRRQQTTAKMFWSGGCRHF